jgi:murein hydrolase activator
VATAALAQIGGPAPDATRTIADERRALATAQRQSADASARATRLERAAAAARDAAAKILAQAAAVAARIQSAEADIMAAEAQRAVIEQLKREQRARLALAQGPTVRLIAALQMLGRRPTALALVQPGSIDDLVHVRALLASVSPAITARTAGLRAEIARGKALGIQASAAVAGLRQSQRRLVDERSALGALALARRQAASALTGSALIEQDRAMAMGEDAHDIGDLMARIGETAQIRARLESLSGPIMRPAQPGAARALPGDGQTADNRQAPYRLPVVGTVVTGLGEVSETGVRARGLTIATQGGAQVVAPTGGRIAYAASYRGYGRIVIIDHGRGWTTLITGLAALDARVGDPVSQGSPIGHAGRGRPTITVELRRQGQPVDIARLIG